MRQATDGERTVSFVKFRVVGYRNDVGAYPLLSL